MSRIREFFKNYSDYLNNEIVWRIGVKRDNEWLFLRENRRFWYADPFLFKYANKLFLFYERYNRIRCNGDICCREISDFTFGKEKIVLKGGCHYSFPNIFELDGVLYMTPETSERNTFEVYKCVSFPDKWVLHKIIKKHVWFADTILYSESDDKIVFLTSNTKNSSCNVENIYITCTRDFNFVSETLAKDYSFYGNRNAGALLLDGEHLYRFGQDCSNDKYGIGIVKYEICNGLENEVSYFTINDFLVDSKYEGIHTLNYCDDFLTIDIKSVSKRGLFSKLMVMLKIGVNYVKRRIKN